MLENSLLISTTHTSAHGTWAPPGCHGDSSVRTVSCAQILPEIGDSNHQPLTVLYGIADHLVYRIDDFVWRLLKGASEDSGLNSLHKNPSSVGAFIHVGPTI